MIIIVGLGNPGKEYENTRHNAGFMAIDALAKKYSIDVKEKKHKALVGRGMIEGNKVVLVKPQTYMNLSGESVRSVFDFYGADISEVIVVYDDIALEVGRLRLREKGSAGGHNGMKNIILHLGTDNFKRIRIGVGDRTVGDLKDHVLGHFTGTEKDAIDKAVNDAADAVVCVLKDGMDKAMNLYNAGAK